MRTLTLLTALSLLSACRSTRSLELEITPSVRAGAATGFFQIPRGGKPGSSTPKRPTLKEMGVEQTLQVGLGLRARFGRHDFEFEGRYLFLEGEGHADGDLTSQGGDFSDGSELESNSGLGTWGITWGYRLPLVKTAEEDRDVLSLTPRLGVAGISVRYLMSTEGKQHTDRSFTHFAPAIGGVLEWRPGGGEWRFELEGKTSFSYRARIVEVSGLELRFGRRVAFVDTWFGLGYQRFRMQDAQRFPNLVEVEFGPTLGFGLGFSF